MKDSNTQFPTKEELADKRKAVEKAKNHVYSSVNLSSLRIQSCFSLAEQFFHVFHAL